MDREYKIHCEVEGDCNIVSCGRSRRTLITYNRWLFAKLKDKYKCLQCLKYENSGA